jgi:poly(A) polymerase
LRENDFIFIISLLVIDQTDNLDYFLYKFNISKKDQNRLKNIHEFYKEKVTFKTFSKDNLNRIFYFKSKETVIDIINFQIFKSQRLDNNLIELIKFYKDMVKPSLPIKADNLMVKYKISEGKVLGDKLRMIEEEWVNNNFKISDQQVENIVNN